MRRLSFVLAALVSVASSAASQTYYSDRATFTSAASVATTYDFEGIFPRPACCVAVATVGSLVVSTPASRAAYAVTTTSPAVPFPFGYTSSGVLEIAGTGDDVAVTFTFPYQLTAFGLAFGSVANGAGSGGVGTSFGFEVFDGPTLLGATSRVQASAKPGLDFFGVVVPGGFTTIRVSTLQEVTEPVFDDIVSDVLDPKGTTVAGLPLPTGTSTAPEPASLVLLAAGGIILLGWVVAGRRRLTA